MWKLADFFSYWIRLCSNISHYTNFTELPPTGQDSFFLRFSLTKFDTPLSTLLTYIYLLLPERASQPGDKLYPYDRSIVNRIANTAEEMNECVDAIMDTIGPDKIVGFDTETKVELNEHSRMPTGIKSK